MGKRCALLWLPWNSSLKSWFPYFVRFFTTWSFSSFWPLIMSGFAGWQRGRCEKRGPWPCSLAKRRQIQKKDTNQGDFQSTCLDHFIKEWTRLGWSWKRSCLVDWLASGLISWLWDHRASFWFVQLIKVFHTLVPNFQRYSSTHSRERDVQRGAGNRCQNGHVKGQWQSGRSCAGARGAPAEKFGLWRKF